MAKKEEVPRCPKCNRPMVTGWDQPQCAYGCNMVLSGSHRQVNDLRPFSKRIFVGSQVYGKGYEKRDSLRQDTEDAMLGGRGYGLKG